MLKSHWLERIIADPSREGDHRPPFRRDRSRILHSAAFRCLQAKTQIHAVGENDFFRTRLTHSLEVAQIGNSLVSQLKLLSSFENLSQQLGIDKTQLQRELKPFLPSTDLIETLCFAHDIGHPPFGHGGETALNAMMCQSGGFEGNAQTFRLLTKLEPYSPNAGMNLCRRTLLGIIKYPAILTETSPQYSQLNLPSFQDLQTLRSFNWKPAKGLFEDDKTIFDWVIEPLNAQDKRQFQQLNKLRENPVEHLKTKYKSLDCSIMELADDIAYSVHDLEDAIVVGMIDRHLWEIALEQLKNTASSWMKQQVEKLTDQLFSAYHYERKNAIGALVNYFITHIHWIKNPHFEEPLLAYNVTLPEDVLEVLNIFKKFVFNYVINDVETQRIEYKGQRILTEMFQILQSDPEHLLPRNTAERWQNAENLRKNRVICDYIAGMSDAYALKVYRQLT